MAKRLTAEVADIGGRLADLVDADEVAHDATEVPARDGHRGRIGRGILSDVEEAELDAAMAKGVHDVREARRRWEMRQAGGKFR